MFSYTLVEVYFQPDCSGIKDHFSWAQFYSIEISSGIGGVDQCSVTQLAQQIGIEHAGIIL